MSEPINEQKTRRWPEEGEPEKKLPPGVKLLRTLEGHESVVHSVAFDPQGEMLASGSSDRTVKLWEVRNGKLLRTLEGHTHSVYCVAFDPKGETLASASRDETVKLWETRSGKLLRTLKGHKGTVYSVAFDPQGERMASGGGDKSVKLWEARTGKLLRTLEGHTLEVLRVAFDPKGETLASASSDRTVQLWEAGTGKLVRTLEGHKAHIVSVAFDPKGEILASGSYDRTVKLWEIPTGKLLRVFEGHTSQINIVAFSPDGRLLTSKSVDETIRVWNCVTGETVAIITGNAQGDWTPALAFHPTTPLLAAAAGSNSTASQKLIKLWELDFDLLLGKSAAPIVTYTSAKVVLVGESNVGKSYLAHRIATGAAPEQGSIESTHGMKFWPLEPANLHPLAQAPTGKPELLACFMEKLFGTPALNKNQRRDIVLWDLGGQEEYRLIHQLFLHDTTVALVLFDPTRGATAFKEVEAWNKSLEKQLRGRAAIKLLVGAKVDRPSEMIDRQGLERLRQECGFADYCETSALTGRGVAELCEAVAKAIDWEGLGKTNRPELFQAIRDEIESRRKKGVVVVLFDDLDRELQTNKESKTFSLMRLEAAMADDVKAGTRALDAVCSQLAQQGTIARARTSSGQNALILRIEEVERYAGALILAAKANQRDRGVPALELRAIAQEKFHFPQINEDKRLPRAEEKSVVECTVQLMLEHGICFQHEGLLIFPSLFAAAVATADEKLPHAVSLYYDFAGAIDNIYASLVAWLVLAKEFGKVRLWSDRAEFEVKEGGLCGLRKVGRPGGFAHVDVYFEDHTSQRKQREFINFVEDHLARNGVEIKERIVVPCPKGFVFDEETLRMCIAAGEREVLCPRCKESHSFTEGAVEARERDSRIAQHTWALRTEIEKLREKITKQVVQVLGIADATKSANAPIRLLHLSDLHFTKETPVPARLQWLLDDLKQDRGLGFKELDYLVISGDFTDKGCLEGFEKAYEFVSGLTQEFGLSAERCIFVPGNHDICNLREAYEWREKSDGLKDGDWVQQGDIILARNAEKYPLRLKPFSDAFYHKFLQRPYPLEYAAQGFAIPFWESGIQFLTLNSCWRIDQFHRKRSDLHAESVANAIRLAQKQERDARKTEQLAGDRPLLRIAVWHHAVAGPEQIKDIEFLGNLQKNGIRLALHGDVHEERRDLIGYWRKEKLHVIGSGSFGARAEDRPEASPRLYNVIEIARDLGSAKVHTRCQPKPDGPWEGWYKWEDPRGRDGRVAFYEIKF